MNTLNSVDLQYQELCKEILNQTNLRNNRTKINTYSIFGRSLRFNLKEGFPIITTKKVAWKSAFHETLWMFCQGNPDCKYLKENNVKIWNEWIQTNEEYPNGTIGNLYGQVLRHYKINDNSQIDQLQNCIDLIKNNPNSRRIIMTAWDPKTIADDSATFLENVNNGKGVLAPCHGTFIHFYVNGNTLDMSTYQRSVDICLGLPFNIVGYSLLLHMVAHVCNLEVCELVYFLGDTHLYENQLDAINQQLTIHTSYELPKLIINKKIISIFKTSINSLRIIKIIIKINYFKTKILIIYL